MVISRQQPGLESSEGWTGMDVQDGSHVWLAGMLTFDLEQLGLLSTAPAVASLCPWGFSTLGSLILRGRLPKADILRLLGRSCKISFDLIVNVTSAGFCWSNKPLTPAQIQEERI